MPNVIIVGGQWGDEGKGKIIDVLTDDAQHVVRAQGGNNAGHTVLLKEKEYQLHLIPSGILHPHPHCYIGAGTVVDPEVLIEEIHTLTTSGIDVAGRLWLSPAAHVIFPYHKRIDSLMEQNKKFQVVGTTGRGIGPCYADKANRLGIRVGELLSPNTLKKSLSNILELKNRELAQQYGAEKMSFDSLYSQYLEYGKVLKPSVQSVEEKLALAISKGENILFEGAQGTFLDITFGTYPFVTSSNTTAGGVCAGAGVGPTHIHHTVGVFKAYATRVGHGPFPTEIPNVEAMFDHKKAREFGTTTGRKRRIGWFDAVFAKRAVHLNGLDSIALTKLDILDSFDHIKICTSYELDGKKMDTPPEAVEDLERVIPIYETLPGWRQPTRHLSSYDSLPEDTRSYMSRIEKLCGVPIDLVSVGPERSQTLVLHNPFHCMERVG